MEARKEIFLELPWDVADSCNGFGMDFGGSVVKTIYMHKDDWREPDKRTTKTVKYRLINFSREEFQDALKYLKQRVFIRRKNADDKPIIYTCGIGGSQYATEIRENFNIRCANITELECLNEAFYYLLKNSEIEDLQEKINPEDIKAGKHQAKQLLAMVETFAADNKSMKLANTSDTEFKFPQEIAFEKGKKFTDLPDLFPCMFVLGGSSGGALLFKEDGTYELANEISRAGKLMMGLASLLTGCKTYEEFMALAEKGDMHNIHQYMSDMRDGVDLEEDNMYSKMIMDDIEVPGFLFGKCVFKDLKDFKPEDLALSLLYTRLHDYSHTVHTTIRCYPQVKHVFFCGGLTSHPLARKTVINQWLQKDAERQMYYGENKFTNTHFLKQGQHLGALGSLLNQKLQFKVVKDSDIK